MSQAACQAGGSLQSELKEGMMSVEALLHRIVHNNEDPNMVISSCLTEVGRLRPDRPWTVVEALLAILTHQDILPAVDVNDVVLRRLTHTAKVAVQPEALTASFHILWKLREHEHWFELVEQPLAQLLGQVLDRWANRILPEVPDATPANQALAEAAAAEFANESAPSLLSENQIAQAAAAAAMLLAQVPGSVSALAALRRMQEYAAAASAAATEAASDVMGHLGYPRGAYLHLYVAKAVNKAGGPVALTHSMCVPEVAAAAAACLQVHLEACCCESDESAGAGTSDTEAAESDFKAACRAAMSADVVTVLTRLAASPSNPQLAGSAIQILLMLAAGASVDPFTLVTPLVSGGTAGTGDSASVARQALQVLNGRLYDDTKQLTVPMAAALLNMAGGLAAGLGTVPGTDIVELLQATAPAVLACIRSIVRQEALPVEGCGAIRELMLLPVDSSGTAAGGSGSNSAQQERVRYPLLVEAAAARLYDQAVRSASDAARAGGNGRREQVLISPRLLLPSWLGDDALRLAHLALKLKPILPATLTSLAACVDGLHQTGRLSEDAHLSRLLVNLAVPITAVLPREAGIGTTDLSGGAHAVLPLAMRVMAAVAADINARTAVAAASTSDTSGTTITSDTSGTTITLGTTEDEEYTDSTDAATVTLPPTPMVLANLAAAALDTAMSYFSVATAAPSHADADKKAVKLLIDTVLAVASDDVTAAALCRTELLKSPSNLVVLTGVVQSLVAALNRFSGLAPGAVSAGQQQAAFRVSAVTLAHLQALKDVCFKKFGLRHAGGGPQKLSAPREQMPISSPAKKPASGGQQAAPGGSARRGGGGSKRTTAPGVAAFSPIAARAVAVRTAMERAAEAKGTAAGLAEGGVTDRNGGAVEARPTIPGTNGQRGTVREEEGATKRRKVDRGNKADERRSGGTVSHRLTKGARQLTDAAATRNKCGVATSQRASDVEPVVLFGSDSEEGELDH